MKSYSNILLTMVFLAFISFFGIMMIVTPDKETSEVENRTLAGRPPLEMESVINGKFTEHFDTYITDQFYLRDGWIKSYLNWQILTNQTFVYDYYIEEDWVYPKPFTTIDKEVIHFAANSVTELSEFTKRNGIELYYFSLPDRRHMLDIEYPSWVEESVGQADKELLLSLLPKEHINVIDVGEEWKNNLNKEHYKDFYFRTDHHWNMYGAMAGYQVIRDTLYDKSSVFTDEKFDIQDYQLKCLSDKTFLGTYNRQLYGMVDTSMEAMCYFASINGDTSDWSVYVNGTSEENKVAFSDIYGKAITMEEESVTYSDVYAGDYSELHVINPQKANEKSKVLFLKDSYANTLIPLLAEHFYHTTYYDVRHNEGEDLYQYIEENDFDVVALLYSNGRSLEYLFDFKP